MNNSKQRGYTFKHMTNIYLSTRACAHFMTEPYQANPAMTLWHWHAHVFELDGAQHMIVMEDRSSFAVVIFGINRNLEDCIQAFARKLERQIASTDLSPNNTELLLSSATKIHVYPMPFKGKPMAMITHLISKLKSVFAESLSPTAVREFALTDLNDIPWQSNQYKTASEVLVACVRQQ